MLGRKRPVTVSRLDMVMDGETVRVTVRRNPRAKRLIMRPDADGAGATVTIPNRATIDEARDLVLRHATWLREKLKGTPSRIDFADGGMVPYRGVDHTIRHVAGRGTAVSVNGELQVFGSAEHLPRRLTDWLRAEARAAITTLADEKVPLLAVKRGRITIRDTRSRWGSCSSEGNLNFSWRLILAPDFVLDYVVGHEVAHLAHHHHGPEFWAAVAQVTDHAGRAKLWLKQHGPALHLYG